MRILDRYVTREFFKLFLLFSLAAPLLFILGDWTDNIDTYTERMIPGSHVALGYLYAMPQYIMWSFPIAALIATVFTVSNMTRHSEMAAAKAGGISFFSALRMLPMIGLVLTVTGLGLSELVPIAERARKEVMATNRDSGYNRSDFVYSTREGDSYAITNLNTDDSTLRGINVERQGDLKRTASIHIVADEAAWDSVRHQWTLRNGYYRTLLTDSTERAVRFNSLRTPRFRETPEQLSARPKDPEEMRFGELGDYIQTLRRSGNQPHKLMVQRLEKIAIPVATLIIILFGAPLANTSSRGGPAYGIGISLGITIVYLMFFKVTEAAGATGTLPVFLGAWLPNLVFATAAVILLKRLRT